MATTEEAQQKALLSYGALNHLKDPDGKVQQMLQQDKDKLLASILVSDIEPIKIPLISPMANSGNEKPDSGKKEKKERQSKKSKNAFVRSFKKFLYFKPKTFWGTQILVPILSTVIGIWVTAIVKQPKIERPHHHRPPITQQAVTNKTDTVQTATSTNATTTGQFTQEQITQSFNLFYQLYQTSILNQSGEYKDEVMSCPTCKHRIQVSSAEFSPASVKCLVCNQTFQSVPKQEESKVRN